jgi:hypothetical protein
LSEAALAAGMMAQEITTITVTTSFFIRAP